MYRIIDRGCVLIVSESKEGTQKITGSRADDGAGRTKGRTDGATSEGESTLSRAL